MAFPVIPAILAVGAVAWAWWLGKNSNSKQSILELENEIVEATVELLPYQEGKKIAPDAPDILSKIAKAIADTGSKDIEKIRARLDPADHQHAEIYLTALKFLQWMEQSKPDEYSALALPYHSDTQPNSSSSATDESLELELENVFASVRAWLKRKQQTGEINLPIEIAKECGCLNSKGGTKKLFKTKAEAEKIAALWRKKRPDQPPQGPYNCPKGKGFHLHTKKKPN